MYRELSPPRLPLTSVFRLYPRLMESCLSFDGRPEDLQVERYAEAVMSHLSLPPPQRDAGFSDVSVLSSVLSAASAVEEYGGDDVDGGWSGASSSHCLEGAWLHVFQRHCAGVLVAGVTNGFIRNKQWLHLLGRFLGCMRATTASGGGGRYSSSEGGRGGEGGALELAAAVAWAMTHESAPFGGGGGGGDLQAACKCWVQLLGPPSSGGIDRGGSAGPAAAASGLRLQNQWQAVNCGNSDDGRSPPGIGAVVPKQALAVCMEAGRSMGLLMPSGEEFLLVLCFRLGGNGTVYMEN